MISCSIVSLIWKLALGFVSVVHVALYYPLFLVHVALYYPLFQVVHVVLGLGSSCSIICIDSSNLKTGFGLSGYLFIDFYTGLCGYIYIHFILERGVGVLSIIVSGFHVHCGCPRYLSTFPFGKLALGFWPAVWICVSSCVVLFIHSLPLETGFGFCATFPFWKLALGFV